MQRSNQFSMEIRINENTSAKELINVSKNCHCVTYCTIGERPWTSSSQTTPFETNKC